MTVILTRPQRTSEETSPVVSIDIPRSATVADLLEAAKPKLYPGCPLKYLKAQLPHNETVSHSGIVDNGQILVTTTFIIPQNCKYMCAQGIVSDFYIFYTYCYSEIYNSE